MHIYTGGYNLGIFKRSSLAPKTCPSPNIESSFFALGPKYRRENTKAYGRSEKTIWDLGGSQLMFKTVSKC